MRILSAFATFVGVAMLLSGVASGDRPSMVTGLAVTLVAGGLLWRSLRNPEASRRAGLRVTVTFTFEPGSGIARQGSFARVATHNQAWNVALDRTPEGGDMDVYDVAHRGWVWLDANGMPEKVRINYGTTWKSWRVLDAAVTKKKGQGT